MSKKTLAKNSFYNILYQGFSAFFPLLTATYISRVLEPDGVGKISYATVLVSYFVVLASLGLPNYGIRAIAQNNNNIESRSKTYFELLILNGIATSISCVVYFSVVNFLPYFTEKSMLLNIVGIELVLNYFSIDWFYKGIEEYRIITTRAMVVKIISFVCMLLFVKSKSDYYIYAMILSLGYAGNYIFNIIVARRFIKVAKYKLELKKHLSPILILFAATVASQFYSMLDTLMLEFFYKDAYVGYYSNSVKIVRMIHTFVIAVVAPFYPRISMYLKSKMNNEASALISNGIKILFILALPCFVGISLIANDLVLLMFGPLFSPSIICIMILSPLIIILSFAYFAGHVVLMSVGKEKYILFATVFSAVENFLLNLFLIPKFQHYGAAIASVIAELTVTMFVMIKAKKHYTLEIEWEEFTSVLVSLICMIGIALLCHLVLKPGIIRLVSIVVLSTITYGTFLIITKNRIIKNVIKKIIKRVR